MDCSERERLAAALRDAEKKLQWLHEEEYRLVEHEAASLNLFDEAMRDAQTQWYAALDSYRKHIEDHGCADTAEAPNED
jgi:hypothetical protein